MSVLSVASNSWRCLRIGGVVGCAIVTAASAISAEDCWSSGSDLFQEHICCDAGHGVRGWEQCFDEQFTYEQCCILAIPCCAQTLRANLQAYVQSSTVVILKMPTGKPKAESHPGPNASVTCAEVGGSLYRAPVCVTYDEARRCVDNTVMCVPLCCDNDEDRAWVASQLVFHSMGDYWGEVREKFHESIHMGHIGPLPSNKEELDVVMPITRGGYWSPYYERAEPDMEEQWTELVFPMIQEGDFTSVLEVGAGRCRNTEKLVTIAQKVIVTDVDPAAVSFCRKRFKNRVENEQLEYRVVDGMRVPIPDESVSFIYQFDSGVHFHRRVIQSYLREFERVLMPGGTGFFHYSNLGALPEHPIVDDENALENVQARSNMTRTLFEEFASEAGLEILCNPLVNWNKVEGIDAFARFRKRGGLSARVAEACPNGLSFDWKGVSVW